MRSFAQPRVLARAGLAALATALACYPRLALWLARPGSLQFVCLTLLWTTFILWGFVFAWHEQYSGNPVFPIRWQPRLWGMATVYGLTATIFLCLCIDPQYRLASPDSYPTNFQSWTAMSLFALAFDPLFYCFAPYAFFVRLAHRQNIASVLTVIFGVFVLFLKLHSAPRQPPIWLMAEQMAGTVIAGFLSLYFYLKGGAWLVWWPLLLTQLRHLLSLI